MSDQIVGPSRQTRGVEPRVEPIPLPPGYKITERTMVWDVVRRRLEEADHYWIATTRPDGRPHVVPVDGVWLDGVWFFGGHPDTVHQRNLRQNPEIVLHLEDALRAVILEGRARWLVPTVRRARELAAVSRTKYGWAPPPDSYRGGLWQVTPRRVLAWNSVAEDPTRFSFDHYDEDDAVR